MVYILILNGVIVLYASVVGGYAFAKSIKVNLKGRLPGA